MMTITKAKEIRCPECDSKITEKTGDITEATMSIKGKNCIDFLVCKNCGEIVAMKDYEDNYTELDNMDYIMQAFYKDLCDSVIKKYHINIEKEIEKYHIMQERKAAATNDKPSIGKILFDKIERPIPMKKYILVLKENNSAFIFESEEELLKEIEKVGFNQDKYEIYELGDKVIPKITLSLA